MTTQNITLFKALGAKMDYLSKRQNLISENVANADTPGYRPKDLKPVDFGRVLRNVHEEKSSTVALDLSQPGHMTMAGNADISNPKLGKQKETYEVSPSGNAVIMEEQLIKSGKTVMDYNLMSNLYAKQVGMIRTALGQQGG